MNESFLKQFYLTAYDPVCKTQEGGCNELGKCALYVLFLNEFQARRRATLDGSTNFTEGEWPTFIENIVSHSKECRRKRHLRKLLKNA